MIRLLLLLVLCVPLAAQASESAPAVTPRSTATLVSASDVYAPGRALRLGLRLRLAPGWHSYWSNPGDAGAPPSLALDLPAGARAGRLQFPAPELLLEGGLAAYAYAGDVLLPVSVTLPASGAVTIVGHADWLACANVCVPEHADLRLSLSPGSPAPSAETALFAAAERRLPLPSPFSAVIAPDGQLIVRGPGLSAATIRSAYLYPDAAGVIAQAAPQRLALGEGRLALRLAAAGPGAFGHGISGVLALTDRGGATSWYSLAAKPGVVSPEASDGIVATGLWASLGLALLGGLVLNLMPCVFPVLAMKAVALSRLAGTAQREVRVQSLLYSTGVVASFTLLGAVLLVLRVASGFAGWGTQFQSPLFVAGMAWLLFGVGLALSGGWPILSMGRLGGIGARASAGGRAGALATGGLAVLVATPCTAPFMASALAAAFAAPLPAALGIFVTMGIGLALPTLALAVRPGIAGWLPRPGAWMDVLRQALAFPLYAASLWLLWVLAREAGSDSVLVAGAGALLIAFAAWVLRVSAAAGALPRRVGRGLAVGSLAALGLCLAVLHAAPVVASQAVAGQEPFSAARLASLRAEGRPVFVDLTADWCLTCVVNERVALSPAAVRAAFAAHDVAYLRGDWTRDDPEITRFLREQGRQGVPLYLVYRRGAASPLTLPQILTEGDVLKALAG